MQFCREKQVIVPTCEITGSGCVDVAPTVKTTYDCGYGLVYLGMLAMATPLILSAIYLRSKAASSD